MDRQTEHIDDLLEGYALDALEPDEQRKVEQHIAVCPPCQQQARAAADAAHLLSFAVAPVVPPRRCKVSVMEKITREQFLATPAKRSWTTRPVMAWYAVATVAVLMTAWSLNLQRQLNSTQTILASVSAERAAAQTEIAQMRSQIGTWQTERATMEAQLVSMDRMLASAEAVRTLEGEGVARNASGKTFMKPGSTRAILVASNLPALPENQTYQVWVARGNQQEPLSTFKPDDTTTLVEIAPPEPMDSYTAIMVTVENAPGAQTPSGVTVLSGNL